MSNDYIDVIYQLVLNEYNFMRDKIDISQFDSSINYDCKKQIDKSIVYNEAKLLTQLPVYLTSAIFVRQNCKQPRYFTILMTGMENTPYNSGCILLQAYLPDSYPEKPLKIKCKTETIYGKFNPNILGDGKIFSSLLNTWAANNSYEKWDPKTSSLYQVLVSFQTELFTQNPYFNGFNKEQTRNTIHGKQESTKYNQRVQMITIAECMYKMLKDPPKEFENIIKCHFFLKKEYIHSIFDKWLLLENFNVPDEYKMYKNFTLKKWISITKELIENIDEKELEQEYDSLSSSHDPPAETEAETETETETVAVAVAVDENETEAEDDFNFDDFNFDFEDPNFEDVNFYDDDEICLL
jgi:ubiquitin-protein ligase